MATWNGSDVVVLAAYTLGGLPLEEVGSYPDEHVRVRISFIVEGPRGEEDPPWGPLGEATVPLSDLAGPVNYPYVTGSQHRRMVVRSGVES